MSKAQVDTMKQNNSGFAGFFKKTKSIFNKIFCGLKWAYCGKFKWAFIIPSILIIIYIAYFTFVFAFNGATYSTSHGSYGDYDIMKGCAVALGALVGVITISKVIFDVVRKKYDPGKIIVAIFVLAITIRICYMIYTPIYYNYGSWRQHDLGYGSRTGHYGIIMDFFRTWEIPDMIRNADGTVNFSASGQLYQPKLVHILYAIFMHINSIFVHFGEETAKFLVSGGSVRTIDHITMNEYALFEMNRILGTFISCYTLIVLYRILKEFKLSKRGFILAFLLVAFTPVFYMFSTSLNNDSFSFFFGFLAILYAIRWYKNGGFVNIILIAITLGCGMSCKLSIGFLALFIGGLFIYKLVKNIIYSRKGMILVDEETKYTVINDIKYSSNSRLVIQLLVFALIVFPIGLSYPIYAKIRFDQPFNYVWLISKYNWNYVDESISPLYRFLIYPAPDFFKGIFVENHSWVNGAGGYVDPRIQANIWNYILKSSLFGEYTWNFGLSAALYVVAFITMWATIGFGCYLIYKTISNRIRTKTNPNFLLIYTILVLGITYTFLAVQFNITYPFTCSQDYRYFVPFTLVAALILAVSYDKLDVSTKNCAVGFKYLIFGLVISFSICSYILYLA